MPQPFHFIATEPLGDVLIIEITAPALNDFDISHRVADEVDAAFAETALTKAAVNLKDVQLLTSVGLLAFVRMLRIAESREVCFVLCGAQEVVADVLRVSRLAISERAEPGKIAMTSDLESALQTLNSR
jgi:anti-anti-sigma factor